MTDPQSPATSTPGHDPASVSDFAAYSTENPTREATSPILAAAPAPVLERPHPLTPIAKGWIAIIAVLVFLLRDLPDRQWESLTGTWWLVLAIIGAVLLISLLVGYLDWRFTRFIIDDEQVRIERNFIWHRSERIAFTKIQSVDVNQRLVARLLGLAALRIDVGSTGSTPTIDYLSRQRAYQLRDYLITRAHGTQTTVAASAQVPVGGLLADRSIANPLIVAVPPGRLVGSLLASSGTVLLLIFATVAAIVIVVTGRPELLLSSAVIVPWGIGLGASVLSRIRNEWNYTLTMTPDGGLRTSSGLTSLTSQTIPRDRVQAIDISQPLLWRPLGWFRVRLDVLGLAHDSGSSGTSNVLLPVGPQHEVDAVLTALWPHLDLPAIQLRPIPSRARRLRWLDAHTYRWGHDDQVLVASGRLLNRRTSIVPHARVQSVRLHQGPLQRLLDLASVQAHTTPGPVDVVCRHLDATDARLLAMSELDRMRAARLGPPLHQIATEPALPPGADWHRPPLY